MDNRQLLPKLSVHQRVILSIAVLGLALSFCLYMEPANHESVFVAGFHTKLPGTCMSRQWFDLECPGCGLTRSIVCISRGELMRSLQFNLAGILFYLYAVGYLGYVLSRHSISIHSFFHSAASWKLFVWLTMSTVFAQWCLKTCGIL